MIYMYLDKHTGLPSRVMKISWQECVMEAQKSSNHLDDNNMGRLQMEVVRLRIMRCFNVAT